MAAPKGNKFWLARSSHGRKPIFANPEQLWTACLQYFEWNEAHPLFEAKAFAFQGEVTIKSLPKMRAMTIGGLCLFLDIDTNTWKGYASQQDFFQVTREAEETIRLQKFQGASADLLNANIIARDLGLADKAEFTGKEGAPIEFKDVSDNDRAAALAAFWAKTGKK